MKKVTVVGAGAVGATSADNIVKKQIAHEVVLLDIKEGLAEGKSIDIQQTASTLGFSTQLIGVTNDYKRTAHSDVVVITSGLPRKPGMTREELIGVNANIVGGVAEQILQYSPNTIIVVVSNPMDTMTYLTLKRMKLPAARVIGMGGILDSSRFKFYLSQALGANAADIQAMVIGGHGDTTMIPLIAKATWQNNLVSTILNEAQQKNVVENTMKGGATLTALIGTSAWYAPGASVAVLVESILCDQKRVYPCSVMLDGQYGEKDICIGVPVRLGAKGCEAIIEIPLSQDEKVLFKKSADAVRSMNDVLKTM